MILDIDADDSPDPEASSRFTSKELRLFEATLRVLLSEEYLRKTVGEQYAAMDEGYRESIVQKVLPAIKENVSVYNLSF